MGSSADLAPAEQGAVQILVCWMTFTESLYLLRFPISVDDYSPFPQGLWNLQIQITARNRSYHFATDLVTGNFIVNFIQYDTVNSYFYMKNQNLDMFLNFLEVNI